MTTTVSPIEAPPIGQAMSIDLPDGSTCTVERTGHATVLVCRRVRGAVVWGQAFTPEATDRIVSTIVGNPVAFVR